MFDNSDMTSPQPRLSELYPEITKNVNKKLAEFLKPPQKDNWLKEMHKAIKDEITNVLLPRGLFISAKALSWLTDQHFTAISINDRPMSDFALMNEFPLSELKNDDVKILFAIYDGSKTKIETRLLAETTLRSKQLN